MQLHALKDASAPASVSATSPLVSAEEALPCAVDAAEADGYTALMLACQSGSEACVRALVQAGAAVDAADTDGDTALSIAQAGGHSRICELLSD